MGIQETKDIIPLLCTVYKCVDRRYRLGPGCGRFQSLIPKFILCAPTKKYRVSAHCHQLVSNPSLPPSQQLHRPPGITPSFNMAATLATNYHGIDLGEQLNQTIVRVNRKMSPIEELREHFNAQQPKFTFERVLGHGCFGVTCRVLEGLGGGTYRRLVVKRALRPKEDKELRDEIGWFKVSYRILDAREETPRPRRESARADSRRLVRSRVAIAWRGAHRHADRRQRPADKFLGIQAPAKDMEP